MKKLLLTTMALLGLFFISESFAQVGVGTNQPDKSSALDIVSTKRGLLIPRLDIPDLNAAAPVNNPAHSLLVFNKGNNGDTPEGFYWWNNDEGEWKAVTAEVIPGDDAVDINGDDFIDAQFDAADNQWNLSFTGGVADQVLVTDENGDPEWIPIEDIMNDLQVDGENGITVDDGPDGERIVKLGGELNPGVTEIITDGDNAQLAITDLINITDDYEDILDADEDIFVVVMQDNGILQKIHIDEFLEEVDLDFINGLTQDGDEVKLGGDLIEPTFINTDSVEGNNLAITGLQEESAESFVTVDENGVLRTAQKSVSFGYPTGGDVTDGTGYSVYTLEVLVEVDINDIGNSDLLLNLPPAGDVEGQVISIKLSDGDEADNYLSIRDNGTEIAYGALPHQMWTFKSNGNNWRLVGQ